jgi:hypothetical protein
MSRIKTTQGQYIDMQGLAAEHETDRAVSNVPINAKGDIIDNRGNVTVTREEIKKEYYNNTIVGDTETISISDDFTSTTATTSEDSTNAKSDQTTNEETKDIKNESTKSSTVESKDTKMDSMEIGSTGGPVEVNRTLRERDGVSYYEVEYDDGSFEELNK